MSRSRLLAVGAIVVAIAVATTAFDTSIVRTAIAVLVVALVLRVGYAMISGLAQPVPEPLPAGELRKVKIGFRCSICGAEVRMTVSPDEDPEPPRHCLEDMELVAPTME